MGTCNITCQAGTAVMSLQHSPRTYQRADISPLDSVFDLASLVSYRQWCRLTRTKDGFVHAVLCGYGHNMHQTLQCCVHSWWVFNACLFVNSDALIQHSWLHGRKESSIYLPIYRRFQHGNKQGVGVKQRRARHLTRPFRS